MDQENHSLEDMLDDPIFAAKLQQELEELLDIFEEAGLLEKPKDGSSP